MVAVEVTEILLNAQSIDHTTRSHAEESIRMFQENHLPTFLLSLSAELANDRKPIESRMLAGLVLKNALASRDKSKKAELAGIWMSIDEDTRKQIKEFLLLTLSSQVSDARSTSSKVISKIASIELPLKKWPDLVSALLLNMGGPQIVVPDRVKQSTLETLGYVCQEIPIPILSQDEVNSILTVIVQGITTASGNDDVRYFAIRALYNAIMFAEGNFKNDTERDYIMKVVCDAARSSNTKIRLASFECLVLIASSYYSTLVPYMNDLFMIMAKAIKEDEECIALQALEFWSTLCDVEINILEKLGGLDGNSSKVPCFFFINQAIPILAPLLFETLIKQDDYQDQNEETWNISMAGGMCISLISRVVGDAILPFLIPFVEENIAKSDWRRRVAAAYAFGSILEGPSPERLVAFVGMASSLMLQALKDENSHVKTSAAWTLGRIFEFMKGPQLNTFLVTESNFRHILGVLIEGLKDVPGVADKCCGAIYHLIQNLKRENVASSPLTPFFRDTMHALLITAQRSDVGESRLRVSAYETLNQVVGCATEETISTVVQLVPDLMRQLHASLDESKLCSVGKEAQYELQGLLCGCLQVSIQMLSSFGNDKFGMLNFVDQLMNLFIRVLANESSNVHKEAMLAISTVAYTMGAGFIKHMPDLVPYLEMSLRSFDDYELCAVTVGVLGDLCSVLNDKILPLCDDFMMLLLQNLCNDQIHRSVKPLIFSCLGDIALAIGEHFDRYLVHVMPTIRNAAELVMLSQFEDDEAVEFANKLRNGVLEAYSGILQGFKSSAKIQVLMPYAAHVFEFLESIYQERDMSDTVTKAAIGVLGDLADTLGTNAAPLLRQSAFYRDFVDECLSSNDCMIKETARWAQTTVQRVISG